MKIKPGFILKHVAGKHIVVPVGSEAVHFNGLITLNESGVLLFEALQKEVELEDLIQVLTEKYVIDTQTAKSDVLSFLDILKSKSIIL